MSWRLHCIEELDRYHCFSSAFQKSRFIEMYDKVKYQPFFTKGLCKCLFLSAWDQEHTTVMQNMLQELMDQKAHSLDYMIESGKAKSETNHTYESAMYQLATFFLTHPGETPDESWLLRLSRHWIPLGDSVLQASEIIDRL